jgi:hypothetical protein
VTYPSTFHRLVVIGDQYGDTFNWTMSIIPKTEGLMGAEPVTQAFCTLVANVVGLWWRDSSPAGAPINGHASAGITSVKLNRIGANGKYADEETREYVFPTRQQGNVAGNPPAQLAVAVSLLTAVDRGRAHRGRFYLPALSTFIALGTDGRATASAAGIAAAAGKRLVDQINDLYDALPVTDTSRMRVGVASDIGGGTFREATCVAVGRVPDTMRSRRSSLVEDAQLATIAVG